MQRNLSTNSKISFCSLNARPVVQIPLHNCRISLFHIVLLSTKSYKKFRNFNVSFEKAQLRARTKTDLIAQYKNFLD